MARKSSYLMRILALTEELYSEPTGRPRRFIANTKLMELTSISATQLWRFRNNHESIHYDCVPFIKFGGQIYYEIADIDSLLYMSNYAFPQWWPDLYFEVFGVEFELPEGVDPNRYLKTLHEALFPSIPFAETLECWAES